MLEATHLLMLSIGAAPAPDSGLAPWVYVLLGVLVVGGLLLFILTRKKEDIARQERTSLSLPWGDDAGADSLKKVYDFVTKYARDSITWYASRRKPKRRFGFLLRAAAMVLTALAGLIPVTQQLGLSLDAGWATVALAIAALCISFDHFGGFTSGWVRYMLAQQQIERLEHAFLLDWNLWLASAPNPDEPDVQEGLTLARAFLMAVNKVIEDETKQWATDFQAAIKEIERAAAEAADSAKAGAVTVEVENPGDVDSWRLEVDGTLVGTYKSATAVVTGLAAGIHKVRASGRKGNVEKAAEAAVTVMSSVAATVKLTLS